ncbi:MAG: C25 family cysteine peptidase, partial [candidate division WOR-3 bacterium]
EDDVPYRLLGPVASLWSPGYSELWYRLGIMPSDLYFSEVDTDLDWDTNDDGYYGVYDPDSVLYKYLGGPPPDTLEPTDVIPEVFVGRVLAFTDADGDPNEVANWVSKALNYEKNPGNASGMKNVLYSFDDDPSIGFQADINDLHTHYPQDFDSAWANTSSATLYDINHYYYGWMNTKSHGRWNESWVLEWIYYPDIPGDRFFSSPRWSQFPINDLSDLANQNAYFIHYSLACVQTCYDDYIDPYDPDATPVTDTSIGEGFVEAYPAGGAVASFTNTRLGMQHGSDTIQNRFLDAIFDHGIWFLGAALTQAKATDPPEEGALYLGFYSRYTVNEFGSPTTEAWTDVPVRTFTSVSLKSIPVGVPKTITVTVKYQNGPFQSPLSGARVTLYGCGVYKIGTTGSDGKKVFTNVVAETPGTILATATKHNYLPSWDNITVTGKGDMTISEKGAPLEFFMSLSSSNPVKGNLKLQYGIPLEDEGPVTLKIYDVSGRSVQTVFSEEKAAGYYDLIIPVRLLSTGTYFLRLETRNKAKTEKVIKGGE